jgi:hypothetical protein
VFKHLKDQYGNKLYADGQPVLGRLVREIVVHNSVEDAMLEEERDYSVRQVTCKPVNRIKVYWDSNNSEEYCSTSIDASQSGDYYTCWTATWVNDTGSAQTVSKRELINLSVTADTVYATDEEAIVVQEDEVLTTQWTHTWTINAGSEGTFTSVFKDGIRDYFEGNTENSDPAYSIKVEDEINAYSTTVTGTASVSSFTGTLTVKAENEDSADHVVTKLTVYPLLRESSLHSASKSATVTFNVTTDVVEYTAHGYSNGDKVAFSTTGTLPAALTKGQMYYVRNKTSNDFQLSSTPSGDVIDLADAGSGTHTCHKVYCDWAQGTTATIEWEITWAETV